MAIHRAAAAFRHLSRRLLSSTRAAASPRLLGHFHQPGSMVCNFDYESPTPPPAPIAPCFEPLAAAASPRLLSLDFLPVDTSRFTLYDSRHGLLVLFLRTRIGGPHILVCDPVSRRRALLPPPPLAVAAEAGALIGPALLSRAAGGFEFEVVCLTVDAARRPRALVASVRDGDCSWRVLPRSGDAEIGFDPHWLERQCVHAAGSLYWHICNSHSALALDPTTMEFSYRRAPAILLAEHGFPKFRFGEMPDDGRLCVGALENEVLWLCVQGKGSGDGWVLEEKICMNKVLDLVPGLPKHPMGRTYTTMLDDIDAGRTGKVFIKSLGFGFYSYHLDTGKLDRLVTDEGRDYGSPIFAYFSTTDGWRLPAGRTGEVLCFTSQLACLGLWIMYR
ncbi:hypothetical protein EJB05_44601, partial [Eragrostis curvula]